MVEKGRDSRIFNTLIYLILGLCAFICFFPLMYVVSVSITPIEEVLKNGGFLVIPRNVTLEAYKTIISQKMIPEAMVRTLMITIAGTIINLLVTTPLAYALSKKNLPLRKQIISLIIFTMLFNGGTIPTYLVVKGLGLVGTYWSLLLVNAVVTYNLLVMKAFFENLPEDLFESARMDGANEFQVLFRIALPLSKAVLMTIMLFYAVMHWGTYFSSIIYLPDQNMQTLQVVLRRLLTPNPELSAEVVIPTMTLQMAAVIFSSLPIIIVYPFIQKYFTKGVMLGAVKG